MSFTLHEKTYSCIGKVDTGCNLKEPFSSAPVIIMDAAVYDTKTEEPLRIIPYSTIGGSSYLNAVKAESGTYRSTKKDRETDLYRDREHQ